MTYAIIETETIAAALAAIVATIDPSGRSARQAALTVRNLIDSYQEPDAREFLHLVADVMEFSVPDKTRILMRSNV